MMQEMCSLKRDNHRNFLSYSMMHEICLLMRENTSQEISDQCAVPNWATRSAVCVATCLVPPSPNLIPRGHCMSL